MPYRGKSRRYSGTGNYAPITTGKPLRNYGSAQTTTQRHQFQGALATFSSIAAGEYAPMTLCKFNRNNGTPLSATASNNYQSANVYNGGKIINFKADLYAKSLSSSTTFKIDVYAVALSFYDALVWNTVQPTACPFTFSTTAGDEGEIDTKTISATLVAPNTINNYKFVQHYIKKIGSLILAPTDGEGTTATMQLRSLPPKCRRANLGMYYGLIFHNDASTNASGVFTGTLEYNISFDVIPSEDVLPYLW